MHIQWLILVPLREVIYYIYNHPIGSIYDHWHIDACCHYCHFWTLASYVNTSQHLCGIGRIAIAPEMLKFFLIKEALFTYHARWRESSEWTIGSYFWGCPSLMRQRYFTVKAAWSPACAVTMVTVDEHLGWVMARFGTCLQWRGRWEGNFPKWTYFRLGNYIYSSSRSFNSDWKIQLIIQIIINDNSWLNGSSIFIVCDSNHHQLLQLIIQFIHYQLYIVSSMFASLSTSVVKSTIQLTINYCSIVHHSIHHQLV